MLLVLVAAIAVAGFLGWFVLGPLTLGFKPFTTPAQAAHANVHGTASPYWNRKLRRRH